MKLHSLMAIALLGCIAIAQEAPKKSSAPASEKSSAKKAAAAPAKNAFTPDQMQYGPPPPFLPPGAQVAVLEGNPMATSGDYTIRMKAAGGYKIPPHWHPKRENVTIVSGALKVGMGDKWDDGQMAAFPQGSFAYLDPSMHHYAQTV